MIAKNITTTEVFHKIVLEFGTVAVQTRVTVHNTTIQQAIERCKEFGYVEPKWYEFWKSKLTVIRTESK